MTFKSVPVRLAGTLFSACCCLAKRAAFSGSDRADFTVINGPDPEALTPRLSPARRMAG